MVTEAITIAPALSYCESVAAILSMLHGTDEGELLLDARTADGIGHRAFGVQTIHHEWLSEDVLGLLEDQNSWHIRVSPAVRRTGNRGLLRLHVLFARFHIEKVFDGTEWGLPADQMLAIANRIALFPCPPTAVIDGGGEVVALWRLDNPIDLTHEHGLKRARRAQADLAAALDASTQPMAHTTPSATGGPTRVENFDAHDPAGFLPLVGCLRERVGNTLTAVTIPRLDPEHVYRLEELTDAATQQEHQP